MILYRRVPSVRSFLTSFFPSSSSSSLSLLSFIFYFYLLSFFSLCFLVECLIYIGVSDDVKNVISCFSLFSRSLSLFSSRERTRRAFSYTKEGLLTLSLRVLNLTRKFNEDAPESGSSALSRSHSFALSRRDVRAVFNEDKYLHSISLLIKPLTLDESIAALTVSVCVSVCAGGVPVSVPGITADPNYQFTSWCRVYKFIRVSARDFYTYM